MKNILFFWSSFLLFSCNNTNSQIIEDVSVSQFQMLLKNHNGIILDVRTPQEFSLGHIQDATNINFHGDDFMQKLKILRKESPIYVYCRSGGRSSAAADKMEELGFTNVYNLIGGIGSWESANNLLIKSELVKKINQPTFSFLEISNVLRQHTLVLVNFNTQWCVPCVKMKSVIKEIQQENPTLEVVYIDADVNKELIEKYQIKGVPTFMIFKQSQEVFKHVGIISKSDLLEELY